MVVCVVRSFRRRSWQVSMLHHQLHEVVMKALDPRRYGNVTDGP